MTEGEFREGLADIISEFQKEIDIRISVDKKFVDDWNGKIKHVRNYKSKLLSYDVYPNGGHTSDQREFYRTLGIRSVGELMENRDACVLERVYAYVLSAYFPERVSALRAARSKELFKYGWPTYPVIGALVGIFFKWWLAVGLGALGLLGAFLVLKYADREVRAEYSKRLRAMAAARSYVEERMRSMSEEQRRRINQASVAFNGQRARSIGYRMQTEAIAAQIRAMTKPGGSSQSTPRGAGSESGGSASGRREVVDEYGRTRGYVEDGRIYDGKSELVGYVDSDNRVYNKSGARTGEVGSDGKITEYK